jgi:tRNA threonylcarbamoyladenosine biosynthesis protein TsaE
LGVYISQNLFPGAKILLFGDLGTGKTTFASAIINGLSNNEVIVTSPTFSLIKVYDTKPTIYHIDLYRLSDVGEIEYLDIFSDLSGVYIIEWADMLGCLTPDESLNIYLSYNKDINYRDITIEGKGQKYQLLEQKITNKFRVV